jgi:uncharacterized repeat protein (TIGR01451 family)
LAYRENLAGISTLSPIRMLSSPTRFLSALLTVAVLVGLSPGTTVQAQDLNLSYNANKSPVQPGASVTYTVHVSNTGSADVTGATVTIPTPAVIEGYREDENNDPGNVSCPGSTCDEGETLTWAVGTLQSGQSRFLIYRPVVPSSAPNTSVTATATLSASGQSDVSESVDVIVDPVASVALGIASAVSPVAPNETFTLRINYGAFEGRGGADFGELTVSLPSGLQFIEASGSGSESGGVVSWTLGPLPGGFNGVETVTVQADAGLTTGTLLNVTANLNPGNTGEPVSRTEWTISVHPPEPFLVTLSASDVPTVRDTRSDFAVSVSNTSGSTIQNSEIRFFLPDFLTFDEDETTDPGNTFCPGSTCDPGEFLRWTPGDLEPGETHTLFFEASTFDVAASGALQRFIGFITAPGLSEQTPTFQYGFKANPVPTVGMDANPAPVSAGGTYTYRIITGVLDFSSGADDATLRLELPDDVSFVSATGNPVVADGVVTWAFGPLGAGFSDEQTVTVQANSALVDGELLDARVSFNPGTFGESTMRGRIITPVSPESPLKIALTSNDTPVRSGSIVEFALTVTNDDPFPITDTRVQLVLGGFLSGFDEDRVNDPVNVACPGSTCDGGEIMVWDAGTLDAGEAKTLYFETDTFGPGGDLNRFRGLANASRSSEQVFTPNIAIDATPLMSFGLSGDPRSAPRGNPYTYQLNYGAYAGSGGASNATMRLLLPEGVSPVSTNGGTVDGNAVEWALGAVGAGDGGRRVVEVEFDDNVPEGALLVARASLASGNTGETTQRVSFPVTTLDSNPLSLTVTTPQAPVQSGQQVTYDVAIENTGSANVANPTVLLFIPNILSSFDEEPVLPNVQCSGSTCDAGEILTWTPPDLTPGQTRTLSFTTNVFSSDLLGDMIRMRLQASGAGAETIYQTVKTGIANSFVLPVELTTFTATTSGDAVTLAWSTASETNNAGFDIERSTDGETFAALGSEPGFGTTTETQTYRFIDRDPPFVGTVHYRLKQVDLDGTTEYSEPVTVHFTPQALELLPNAPNPFAASTRLRYALPEDARVNLNVYDLLGRRVATLVDTEQPAGRYTVMLDGADLASGTYFVRLRAGTQVRTQRVVMTQ